MKTLEDAQKKAEEWIGSSGNVSQLVSEADAKAKQNYDALLPSWESLQILIRMIRAWFSGEYRVPMGTVVGGIAALMYLVDPFDLIPDSVPVFGYMDDAAVIAAVMRLNLTQISRFRLWEVALPNREAKNRASAGEADD